MKPYHKVENISLRDGALSLEIDGKPHSFALADVSQALASATDEEKTVFEVSPAGYGIHWPLIDEDLSIDGLLGIKDTPDKERKSA